jgi:hypothetical protein
MATPKVKKRRDDENNLFYETMPFTHNAHYGDFAAPYTDEAPDHDFDAIEDDGRDVAIKTLVFVAIATVVVCLLLLWGVQAAREMLPATTSLQR